MATAGNAFAPDGWDRYDARARVAFGTGLFARAAVVNRFQARYRLARAFRGMNLDGYSEATVRGYNALTEVSLHWTAFEAMLEALRTTGDAVAGRYSHEDCISTLRAADEGNRFFRFVHAHLDANAKRLRRQLESYLDGKACPSLPLAKSIRHIFFHGMLTPNAQAARPENVEVICKRLSRSLVIMMNSEFRSHVDDLVEMFP